MAGVMSLMQPQGQQGPMPGQAPQQPMQGMMPQQGAATPAAMVGPLTQMHMQQLIQLMLNPRPEGPPLYAVISAIAEKQKTDKAMQAAQGQQVMAQNQQMQQQPPVAAQVVQAAKQTEQQNANPEQQLRQRLERAVNSGNVAEASAIMDMLKELEQSEFTDEKPKQGYADGGAVAFQEGGRTFGYAPDYELARKYGINLSPYDSPSVREEKIKRARAMADFEEQRKSFGDIPTEASVANQQAIQQAYASPSRARDVLQTGIAAAAPVRPPAPAPMQPARRPPAGNKPSAMSQGLGALAEQPPTPAPDTLSDIEAGGIRDIKALQDVIRQQGAVDPRLAELREAAYKSSQDIAARRERDRQAMLEAAQKQYADPTDLLLAMAGSAAGGRTALDVLGGAAKGAGAARATKRAELQKVQEVSRQEQNAIDTLNQALADKRVADMTGDVNQRREADRKVAEAQLKVTDLRSGIQKERATEEDRKEQRKIAREQIANQLKIAQIGAAARESTAGLAEQRLALQAMRADPNYAAIVKELTEAKKMAGLSSSPTLQTRLRAAEKAARDLATAYGVTPGMMGMGGAGAAAPEGKVVDFNDIGKK